jgi:hypothetical protein
VLLFFPVLFVFAVIALCFSPVLIWTAAPPGWHPALAVIYATVAIVTVAFWVRALRRTRANIRANAAASADWRWLPQTPGELFRRRIEIFLSMRGWHVGSSAVAGRDRVQLLVRKERWTILLLFVGPRPPAPDAEDVIALQALAADVRASFAALITADPCGQDVMRAVRRANVLLLRYPDVDRLDEVLSVATFRQSEE